MDNEAPYEPLIRYISSLSDDEREAYKDLIADALRRDRLLSEHFSQGRKNTERFAETMKDLLETARGMQAGISFIYERLSAIRDAADAPPDFPLDNGPCLN